VAGLDYLATEGYEHRSLTCADILLNTSGDVKIGSYIIPGTRDARADTDSQQINIVVLKSPSLKASLVTCGLSRP
jgi:hypothetical protein